MNAQEYKDAQYVVLGEYMDGLQVTECLESLDALQAEYISGDPVAEGTRPLRERYDDALEVVRKQALAIEELEAINERQAQTIALLKRAAPPLTRLWASSTGLLDRFEAYPTVIQASKRMMDEATELIVAANDTYGHSTEDIAKEAVDVWVTAINVLRAAQVDDGVFYQALEDVMTSNDDKTDKTHQRSAQNGVERLPAKEIQS